jgi:hypothetical protein
MKLLIFLSSFLIYSCSTKPVVVVDLTKWYNTVRTSEYTDSQEYFSFIGSNLSGKHYALMNFDKRDEKLVVTFALNDGDFDFKNHETIKVRFDNGDEEQFQVHQSSSPNLIHIFQDDKFATKLAKADRLRVELKIKDYGIKTFDWRKVSGLQQVYYRNNPLDPIKI